MAIAFLCNKDLTIPFEANARFMRAQGEEVVWLSPSTRWTKWLVGRGWPRSAILNLPDHRAEWAAMPEAQARAILAPYETDPTVTAVHITRMCRGLLGKEPAYALGYLAVAVEAMDRFMAGKDVTAVLGEATWGFELAAWLVARKRGVPHLNPARTRLPDDRFCLVEAVYGTLVEPTAPTAADFEAAKAFYADWASRPRPAFGLTLGGPAIAGIERAWLREIGQITAHAADDAGDETLWPLRRRMADRARRIRRERSVAPFLRSQPAPPSDPYLLLCLHHQPEAAIDVMGAFNSNQGQLVENIARMLPATHRLHVRAHRAGLGDFSLDWWRDLARIPGVVIVDPFEDIWPQMKNSAATVAVCGTVLFEAALLGVPALGLGSVHFSELFAIPASRRSTLMDWPLSDLLDPAQRERWVPDEPRRLAYLAKLFANSGQGNADDLRRPADVRADPDWQRREADFLIEMLGRIGVFRQAGRAETPAPAMTS